MITGAGSGIGREAARLFAREGAAVVAVDVDGDAAAETAATVGADGGEARPFVADVSRGSVCEAMVADAETGYGRLDVLFNNAGIMRADDDETLSPPTSRW